ncbi:MAG: hypothetical protein J6Z31_01330 [Fibrobacter sp.]|nr:hypothetical protein [Fibrobacter sp.]
MINAKVIYTAVAFSAVLGFAASPEVAPVLPTIKDSCYQVSTVEELYGFASAMNGSNGFTKDTVNVCMALNADITINKDVLNDTLGLAKDTSAYILWKPPAQIKKTMTILGNGHTISGLVAIQTNTEYPRDKDWGFVGYAKSIAISDFHLKDAFIGDGPSTVYHGVGGFVGAGYVTVMGSSFDGRVNAASRETGGFVGDGSAFITNGRVGGKVSGGTAGGFVGKCDYRVEIKRSYNEAAVHASQAGGFVGEVYNSGKMIHITESYNKGTISTNSWSNDASGFVGHVSMADVIIYNAYNAGDILVSNNSGSLVGTNQLGGTGPGTLYIYNTFNIGKMYGAADDNRNYKGLVGGTLGTYSKLENSFVLNDSLYNDAWFYGEPVDAADFANGNLLKKLQMYGTTFTYYATVTDTVMGLVWSQNVGVDPHPVLAMAGDAIVKKARPANWKVSVQGNAIVLSGIRKGSLFAVYDLQGKVFERGVATGATQMVELVRPGVYAVRVNGNSQLVKILKSE